MIGHCKDCIYWSQDLDESKELRYANYTEDGTYVPTPEGYGSCRAIEWTSVVFPSYDGGYCGELITKADFGCILFEAA